MGINNEIFTPREFCLMWDEFGRSMHIYICWNLCMKWLNWVLLYFIDRAANHKGTVHIELQNGVAHRIYRNILKHRNNYSHMLLIQNTTSKYLPVHWCNVWLCNPVFIVDFFISLYCIPFHIWVQSSLLVNLKIFSQ